MVFGRIKWKLSGRELVSYDPWSMEGRIKTPEIRGRCEMGGVLLRLFYSIAFKQMYAYYIQNKHCLRTFSEKQDKILFDSAEIIFSKEGDGLRKDVN